MPQQPTSNFRTPKCPYACTTCGLCFSTAETLIFHQKEHAKGLQLTCPECGARFARHEGFKIHHRSLHPDPFENSAHSTNNTKIEDDAESISSVIEEYSPEPERVKPLPTHVADIQPQHLSIKEEQEPFLPPFALAQEEWVGAAWGERPPKQRCHSRPFAQAEKSLLEVTKARVQRGGRGRPSLKDRGWTDEDIAEHRRQRNRSKDRRRREKQKRKSIAEKEKWELKEKELQEHQVMVEPSSMDGFGAFLTSLHEWDRETVKSEQPVDGISPTDKAIY